MSKPKQFVFEVIMDDWSEWPGNELYDTFAYAQFCAEQDYKNSFYDRFLAGVDEAPEPGRFYWDFICKGLYHMLEDESPTGVSIKIRHVNSLEDK